ncbi:hypothetical protein [Streptomyces sp. NPDC055056]
MLILVVDDELGPQQGDLSVLIGDLVHVHAPAAAVIVLEGAATDAVVEAVVEAHRQCQGLDVLMSVATSSAPARRALQTRATVHGGALVVHARVDTAVSTACATAV